MIKVIVGIYPSKSIRLLLPSFMSELTDISWRMAPLCRNFRLFFLKSQIIKTTWKVNNIFWPSSFKSTPLSKEVLFISHALAKWRFYIRFLRNILQRLLEECICSLSPLYLGHNKEALVLYLYFSCQCIESFLSKRFSLLWNILQ